MTIKARPFLKWVGGKTQLLPELIKRIPKTWNRETDLYFEPFVGAGALFWELQPKCAYLSDANAELFNTWLAFEKCYVEDFFEHLRELASHYIVKPEEMYYAIRNLTYAECLEACLQCSASRTVFLNKAGFNGLYRVNKAGKFNVPWGQNPNATIFDEENLTACRDAIHACDLTLERCDFESAPHPAPGSLWYADPPYMPISKTSNFTAYTSGGFTYVDQLRLVIYAAKLKAEGVHVLLSQAAEEGLIDQYRRCGFTCDLVQARRSVNSVGTGRGKVGEYIIY